MDCLVDFIGITGCDRPEPESGLFIQQLPGITLESVAAIASADQATYLGVWNDVQNRAIKKFITRINQEFKKRYKLRTLLKSVDLLRYVDKVNNQTAAAANRRGFTIELSLKSAFRYVESAFQTINIQSLSIYLKANATVTVKIFNLDSGEELDSFSVTGVTGWNLIKVNKSYHNYRLFIGYDATAIESVYQMVDGNASGTLCGCVNVLYGAGNCDALIRGAITADVSTTVQDEDLETGANTYGLSAVFSVGCSYESLVCKNRMALAVPLWYLMGSELMIERLFSDRLNRYTTTDKDKAGEMKDYFEAEFERELGVSIAGIDLYTGDVCLECSQQLQVKESVG